MEKLYKFFEFTLNTGEIHLIYQLKHKFNNDLCLLGCFLKDFLTIKNDGTIPEDDLLYDAFVLWFEEYQYSKKDALIELLEYADYYIMIIFEDIKDSKALCAVSTINACFAIDCYPNLIEIFSKYYHHKVDTQTFHKMLKSLTDIVLDRYEDLSGNILNYKDLEKRIELTRLERAVI